MVGQRSRPEVGRDLFFPDRITYFFPIAVYRKGIIVFSGNWLYTVLIYPEEMHVMKICNYSAR